GTGTSFDWEKVARLRDGIPPDIRLIAAGGLSPENVGEALGLLRPHLVDVSSGVERAPGIKDPRRVSRFIQAVRMAEQGGSR
ncbi:N-(5'-phosphoribosyl)anthranilate isomerase, partial [Gemmatimonadota bacterium]